MNRVSKIPMIVVSLSVVFTMLVSSIVLADTKTVKPKGEYAKIDTHLVIEAMQILEKGDDAEKQTLIEKIKSTPENYAPPVFYELSSVLFQKGKKDEGTFWFYAGQLRARFDANRCADSSARQAVGVLNQQYGTPINQYAFQDIQKLEELIPKVVEWDRKTSYNYDHRWINLHGMEAMMSALQDATTLAPAQTALSLPEEKWSGIAEKTRTDYLNGFKEAMEEMKRMKK